MLCGRSHSQLTTLCKGARNCTARRFHDLRHRRRAMETASTVKGPSSVLEGVDIDTAVMKARDWAYLNGLVVRSAQAKTVVHAPIAVLPCPFPRSSFEQAVDVMPLMNRLYDAVSQDSEFLKAVLASAAEFDDFTANLLKIHEDVIDSQNGSEEVVLGIFRSDYMLDAPSKRLLQVEMNAIASSFGALGSRVSCMHAHLLSSLRLPHLSRNGIPHNPALKEIPSALALAHKTVQLKDSVILMVAQHEDSNRYDQQWLTLALFEEHGIPVIRKTLSELADDSRLDASGNLIVDGTRLVSVVYFRSGYAPVSYPTSKEWDARRRIEMSTACKCPSVSYHLAGTKKVQQELVRPGRLEAYLTSEECNRVRAFFAGLWGLEDLANPEVQSILEEAIQDTNGFVLKPQREGGGNNFYGEEAADVLRAGKGLAAYVLMQRILPTVHQTLLLRNEDHFVEDTVSELGIYGTYLRKGSTTLLNKTAGHLLRTKVASSDEGGVAAGFAVIDSPYLIDSETS